MIASTALRLLALIGVMTVAGGSRADNSPAQALMRDHKCYVCHSDDDALAGPAFVDVAKKFRGTPQAVTLIATFVIRGERGGGPWHMPPHPELSPDEAATIARYILSLDAPRNSAPQDAPGAARAPASASPRP